MAAYTGWAAAKKINEVASDVIQKLGHRTTHDF
jgi:hypothetical protein